MKRRELIVNLISDEVTSVPCFVTVVIEDRAYGGPEEGGWWYHTRNIVEKHYCASVRALSAVMQRTTSEYTNDGRYPISSVLSDGEYTIIVADHIPAEYPLERLHYE